MKTHRLFSLIILLIFSSCQNWDQQINYNPNGLVQQIEDENHEILVKYKYKNNGILKESWEKGLYFFDDEKARYSYIFNSEGLLTKKSGYEPGNPIMSSMTGAVGKDIVCSYEYDSLNRLSENVEHYLYEDMPDLNYRIVQQFDYSQKDTIISNLSFVYDRANSTTTTIEYLIDNENNIREKLTYYNENNEVRRLSSQEEYEYDTKNIPINFNPGLKSVNNVLSRTQTVFNYDENGIQSIAYSSVYTYEFEYNRKGYPTKITETFPNETQNIKYYVYIND